MRLVDADRAKKLVHEYMGDYSNAPTRMTVCKTILSMLGDKTQVPTIDPIHDGEDNAKQKEATHD